MDISQPSATSSTTAIGQECSCEAPTSSTNDGFEGLLQEVSTLLQELLARLEPSGPAGNLGMISTPGLADDRSMAGMDQFMAGLSANLNQAATSMGGGGVSAAMTAPAAFSLLDATLADGAGAVRLRLGGNG